MNEQELLNEPVEFSLGGTRIRIRSLTHMRQRAIAQAWLIGQVISEAKDKASEVFGNEADKTKYVMDQMDKIPSGQDLQDKVSDIRLTFPVLLRYLDAALVEKLTLPQLEKLVLDATVTEIRAVIAFLLRSKKNYALTATHGMRSSAKSGIGIRRKKSVN